MQDKQKKEEIHRLDKMLTEAFSDLEWAKKRLEEKMTLIEALKEKKSRLEDQ